MDRKLKIAEILEKHQGEKHLVVLHDYPDPDAIASAYVTGDSEQFEITWISSIPEDQP